MRADLIERLADLAVRFGANLQPGQVFSVGCEPGKETLVRAIADCAYRHGAKFVDVWWFDPWVKRSRIEHAADDTLDYVPPWYGDRAVALGRERGARVALTGPSAPGILDDLDPRRAGRDRLPAVKESLEVSNRREVNWTVVPCPTPAWARLVHPDCPEEEALDRLWSAIERVCRLDEEDPVAAWTGRLETLIDASERLGRRSFDSLHYEAPGTDLTIGLLPEVRWAAARMQTVDGIEHVPNIPTEEVFTSPDPQRADGVVTSTKPLVLIDGTVVRDLVVRFEAGRVTELRASAGEEVMRAIVARDEGASRLGEVALVDGDGRIGALNTVFYDTLLDENAASHIALGTAFDFLAPGGSERLNHSEVHVDFMIGSPDMTVTGVTASGDRVPVLDGGAWRL